MKMIRFILPILCSLWLAVPSLPAAPDAVILLNVSADTTRSFYKDLNPLFAASWKRDTDQDVTVAMTHNGSTLEARAVLGGLDADVVTLNQETDLDLLAASKARLLSPDWRTAFPNESVPFESTVMFLVRAGNPKAIKDWDDLVKPGVRIVMPSPKSSGNGRYGYLAAWAYALRHNGGDESKARDFVARMFRNVAVLDVGGDSATTSFTHGEIGDVLVTFESEAYRIRHDATLDGGRFEPVMPSLSLLARLARGHRGPEHRQARHPARGAGLPAIPVLAGRPGTRGQVVLPPHRQGRAGPPRGRVQAGGNRRCAGGVRRLGQGAGGSLQGRRDLRPDLPAVRRGQSGGFPLCLGAGPEVIPLVPVPREDCRSWSEEKSRPRK